jgi:FAD/FMN-containing dehydrogenase
MAKLIGARLRDALSKGFTGRSVVPGDADYDAARRVWNGTVDKYPALVAYCRSKADVIVAVRAAQDVGVPLAVRGGGHQVAGLSVCEGGLTVDLSGMHTVTLSADHALVRAGGGCLLGHVDSGIAKAGRIVPAGVVSHTGLGGLALGGGFGWTFRNFGLTCDNIVGAEVVTAEGDVVYAGAGGDDDLLWALRGGGGNFGAVTRFDLKTHEVTDVLFGQAVFGLDALPRAVEHYVSTMDTAPDALSAICITSLAPPMPGVPADVVGTPVVVINAVWSGPLDEGAAHMSALLHQGGPVVSSVNRMPYIAVQTMQDDLHPHGRRNYTKSRYLDRVDGEAVKALLEAGATLPGPHAQIEILRMGGASGRVDAEATAFAHRAAPYLLNVVGAWTEAEDTERTVDWVRTTYAAFEPVGSDAGYINFLDAEPDRVRSVYPERTFARLQGIKRRLDPRSVFTGNVPIPPGS